MPGWMGCSRSRHLKQPSCPPGYRQKEKPWQEPPVHRLPWFPSMQPGTGMVPPGDLGPLMFQSLSSASPTSITQNPHPLPLPPCTRGRTWANQASHPHSGTVQGPDRSQQQGTRVSGLGVSKSVLERPPCIVNPGFHGWPRVSQPC